MPVLKKIYRRNLLSFLFFLQALLLSGQSSAREYQIKAAFIFNITQFTEWPSQCFASPQSPAVIGIFGKDPFNKFLEETVSGETIKGHQLVVQHFNDVEEIGNCQILFINTNDKDKLKTIIEKLKGKNVLTISDANGFSKLGGMIRLYNNNEDKINIQVNLEAVKSEDLVISSKLLKLAEIVKTDKK